MELLKKNHIKYGLIMSAVTAVCLMLMEITGQNQSFDAKSPFQIIFLFIAPAVVWYFGIKAKKQMLGGKLTFKQGLSEGFKISVVYGLTSPFVFLIYYLFINPQILEYVRTSYGLANASNTMVIAVDMVAQVISALIFGTIYAAIITLFLKTKN